jgi:hypothetical protein
MLEIKFKLNESAGSGDLDGNGGGETFYRETLAQELLLDAWPPGE